jgi:hypothetical protein
MKSIRFGPWRGNAVHSSSAVALALLSLLLARGRGPAAAPPQRPEPLKGAVVSGKVIACVTDRRIYCDPTDAWFQPLRGDRAVVVEMLATRARAPTRWQVGHSALWVADSSRWEYADQPCNDTAIRYELADLFAGRRVIGPKAKPCKEFSGTHFVFPDPIADARFLGDKEEYATVVHYDYLPAARDMLRLFLITNVGGRGKPGFKTDQLIVRSFPRNVPEKWSFTCFSYRADWDAKKERWYPKPEVEECTFDLAFREPFQALARGEDYYFLTASGKLYRAPKPAKGKHRTVEMVWDAAKSPIVAFIQDADRNRTFLFCDSGPKGKGGRCVFELASGVRLRFYDKALFKPGDQGPDKLRQVLGYARVLETLGYIKEASPKMPK